MKGFPYSDKDAFCVRHRKIMLFCDLTVNSGLSKVNPVGSTVMLATMVPSMAIENLGGLGALS